MSKGLGRIQRTLLDWLSTDPGGTYGRDDESVGPVDMSITEAARAVFAVTDPTDAQRASVRRAARGLADAGLIKSNGRRGVDLFAADPRTYMRYDRRGRARKVVLSETYIQRIPTEAEQVANRKAMKRLIG